VPLFVLAQHINLWLEMDFVPNDLNQTEMHSFENQIAQWIKDYKFGTEK
jgi:hypothetical protein